MEELSDNEREEWLRNVIRDNWLWVVGGIGLGLALLGGWRYWQGEQAQRADAELARYTQGIEALSRNDRERALQLAKELRDGSGASPYADQLQLAIARGYVERRELDGAAGQLQAVIDVTDDAELKRIALSRLAHVRLEQGKPDEALALLDVASAGAYTALFQELRGDAYAAKGDVAAARREYDAALAAELDSTQLDRAFIELKRDSLGMGASSVAAEVAK